MNFKFKKIDNLRDKSSVKEDNIIFLVPDNWDDYTYRTSFYLYYQKNFNSEEILLGRVKIGCIDLKTKIKGGPSYNGEPSHDIKELIPSNIFDKLRKDFFSLGEDIEYYKKINEIFGENSDDFYKNLNDLSFDFERFKILYESYEPSLINSLMRNHYVANIEQFNRIIKGEAELTEYSFSFKLNDEHEININVVPNSFPPTNVHVLIGRNGVGKTWLLHNILYQLLKNSGLNSEIFDQPSKYKASDEFFIECEKDNFAGVIGISFSLFDNAFAITLEEGNDLEVSEKFNKIYQYIGSISKKQKNEKTKTKSVDDMSQEFIESLKEIKKKKNLTNMYLEICKNLNSDSIFRDNEFINILKNFFNNADKEEQKNEKILKKNFKKLSSGHMIIILSLTLLSEKIHEKTIVLIDEPETHLHPPLLSLYIRTLSALLIKKNAVAIIATHSPIILQEVPKSCVNKIKRMGKNMSFEKISIESFATDIDTLTKDIFGFELMETGFYKLIKENLENTFEETIEKFNDEIGFLGRVLIQNLIRLKEREDEENTET